MKTCKYIAQFTFIIIFAFSYSVYCQKNSEEIKRQGVIYMQAGKYGEAIDQFNKYITVNPKIAEGFNLRGYCYEQKRLFEKSVMDFKMAVILAPSNQDYKKNLTRTTQLLNRELYKKIEFHKKEMESDAKNPLNYLELGKAYKYLEIWELAEKWFDEYFKREIAAPADEILNYSEIIVKTGALIKGEKLLNKYVDKYPRDYRLWNMYGYFNIWLGKPKIAKDAFTKALKLKPSLKESEDGLELALNQGVLPINKTVTGENGTPIEKYYKILIDKPGDDNTRFLLVDELIKAERWDEAYQQIQYLQPNYDEEDRYKQLAGLVISAKSSQSANKIDEFLTLLKEYPENREAVRKISEYYISILEFTKAEDNYKAYLDLVHDDAEMRFLYAQLLTSEKKFDEAFTEIQKTLDMDQTKSSYKLLAGQLGILLAKDSAKTKLYIEEVIKEDPDNFSALLAYSTINFRELNLENASAYLEKAKIIDPDNTELIKLESLIETQKSLYEQERLWKKFEEGQKLAKEHKYEEAKPYYDEMINKQIALPELLAEYADLLVNLKNYKGAVTIYDTLITRTYNLDYDKKRGKAFLLSGDSLKANVEFERITKDNPDDVEAKIYLGDTYAKLGRFEDARKTFISVREIAPEEFLIEERIDNLPPEPGTFASFMASFSTHSFSYLLISPAGYFFNDNIDFDYKFAGIGLETTLNEFVSLQGSFNRGNFGNQREAIYFSTMKGTLLVKAGKKTTIGFGYGRMIIHENYDQPLMEAFIKYDDKNIVNASVKYNMTDGAGLFLSPDLVDNRVKAHSLRFDASYNYEDKLKLYGYYQLLFSEKANVALSNITQSITNNIGNYFMVRLGKAFYPTLFLGYEYYYSDFKYSLPVYYCPQEFNSHSLWADWQIANDYEWEVLVSAKIGYVPLQDYIVREGNVKVLYKISESFKLGLLGFIGDTVRDGLTYKSGSLNISAFWSL